jgi:hypothetical protein
MNRQCSIRVRPAIALAAVLLLAGLGPVGTVRASSGISFTGIELTVIGDVNGISGQHRFESDFSTENPLTSPTIVTNPGAQGVLPSGEAFLGYAAGHLTLTDGTEPGDTPDPYQNEVAPPDPATGTTGVSGMLVAFGADRVSDTSVTAGDALNDASRSFIKKLNYTLQPLVPDKVIEVRLEGENGIDAFAQIRTHPTSMGIGASLKVSMDFPPLGGVLDSFFVTFIEPSELLAFQTGMLVLSKDQGLNGDPDSFISAELIAGDLSKSINLGPLPNRFTAGAMKDPFLAGAPIPVPESSTFSLIALGLLGVLALPRGRSKPGRI